MLKIPKMLKIPTQKIDGILPLDKPVGITSAKAASLAQRALAAAKAGHGGTLDPAAEGLLLVMLGEATKFARYLLGADKTYFARLTFGYLSDTDDGEGQLTRGAPPPADLAAAVADILPDFIGETTQIAPAFSAIKHNGRRLYDYARKGETAPPQLRKIRINNIALQDAAGDEVSLHIRCGGGVYIRALARDIGARLGCGCYLSALRRLQIGEFDIKDAISPTQLEETPAENRAAILLPVDMIVRGLPAATLPDENIADLGGGRTAEMRDVDSDSDLLNSTELKEGEDWRVYSPAGRFAGIAERRGGRLHPSRLLSWTREAQA